MSSVFSRIIAGELPGHIVWADDRAVCLMDIKPQTSGHCLVIPREEIDEWTDLPDDLRDHLFAVAQRIARVIPATFGAPRCGLVIAGYGVPHVHLHLIGIHDGGDLDPAKAHDVDPDELRTDAEKLRAALRDAGVHGVADPD